ncbi:MAG: hypothetical protein E6Q68_03620 [Polynucleobacter sp.]|nr:MAG: hypothetical protein E6Q68_03620 [Polynucleobacter sp.]
MKEITIRLWENKKFGTTYGKGLYRRAIYNGTAEVLSPYAKYLLDFEPIESWFHLAKSPVHIDMLKQLVDQPENIDNQLLSWIYRYDNGIKTPVKGFAQLDLVHCLITLQINDADVDIQETWTLPIRSCIARIPGKPTPALIATNCSELNSPQKPSTNSDFGGSNTRASGTSGFAM